jgi:hypothetical protein
MIQSNAGGFHRSLLLILVIFGADILVACPTVAYAQSISVSPSIVETGNKNTVDISTAGFFDLSQVDLPRIGIRPNQGVSDVRINSATAQHLSLSFNLSEDTQTGTRTLFINNNQGETAIALDLILKIGSNICRPACNSPDTCSGNVCVTSGGGGHPGGGGGPSPPPRCDPQCRPPQQCVAAFPKNKCETPQ